MKSRFIACLLVALVGARVHLGAQAALTNNDIIQMSQAKVDKKNIIMSIENASAPALDATPAGLIAMWAANVSADVIKKVQEVEHAKQAPAKFVMRNDDVVMMFQGKDNFRLHQDIVITAIQNAPTAAFDVSPAGLIDLKTKKVDDKIVAIMQQKVSGKAESSTAEIPKITPPIAASSTPATAVATPSAPKVVSAPVPESPAKPAKPAPQEGSATASLRQTRQDRAAIEKELKGMYELSKIATFTPYKVNTPGGVYVINVDGIQSVPGTSSNTIFTYVVEGKIHQSADGGLGRFFSAQNQPRLLKKGERVYITDIFAGGDGLGVDFMTVDTSPIVSDGNTKQAAYKGKLLFTSAIRGGSSVSFPTRDAAAAKTLVDQIVVSEKEATAVHTKTIELNQSIAQVEEIMGKPENIIKLGSKVTYVYKSMKIVFSDGKVSDVQ